MSAVSGQGEDRDTIMTVDVMQRLSLEEAGENNYDNETDEHVYVED